MTSQRWKDLERDTASALGGRRIHRRGEPERIGDILPRVLAQIERAVA
jgi:hypothetical protein